MVEVNKSLDGTLTKAISASEKLKDLPKFMQTYMLAGDFKIGGRKKIDGTSLGTKENPIDTNFEDFTAQLATLDKSSQRVMFKVTNLNNGVQELVEGLLNATAAGKQMNSVLFEQTATSYQAKGEDVAKLMDDITPLLT